MSPLEMLFRLEIEYHRKLRAAAPGTIDDGNLHASYALQSGYEQLLAAIDNVTDRQITQLRERFLRAGDPRDILAAADSVKQLLGFCVLDALPEPFSASS